MVQELTATINSNEELIPRPMPHSQNRRIPKFIRCLIPRPVPAWLGNETMRIIVTGNTPATRGCSVTHAVSPQSRHQALPGTGQTQAHLATRLKERALVAITYVHIVSSAFCHCSVHIQQTPTTAIVGHNILYQESEDSVVHYTILKWFQSGG